MSTEKGIDPYNLRPRPQKQNQSRLEERGKYIQENRGSRAMKACKVQEEKDPETESDYEKVQREIDPKTESGYESVPEGIDQSDKNFYEAYHKLKAWKLARLAICFFNKHREEGALEYELVGQVDYECGRSSKGMRYHVNFLAKPKGRRKAAQQFFAVLVQFFPYFYEVLGCCSLGPPRPKSAAGGAKGCNFCKKIHHSKDWAEMGSNWIPERPPSPPAHLRT